MKIYSPDGAKRNPGQSRWGRKPRIALRSIRATAMLPYPALHIEPADALRIRHRLNSGDPAPGDRQPEQGW
jgi:hypothetical protein